MAKFLFKKGHQISEETRKKISESNSGTKNGMYGKKSWNSGTRKPLICSCCGGKKGDARSVVCIKCRKGENIWNWKGGVSSENDKIRKSIEFRLWREAVFARDNWTCQKTGIKGGDLEAHHILNFADFPEFRLSLDNGVTLSKEAHLEFHKKCGFKNNTLQQLKEFIL